MRTVFCCIALIFLIGSPGYGQYNLEVAINMNECSQCLNNVGKLKKINPAIPIFVILDEQSKKDSLSVIQHLGLNGQNIKYIWSDSLQKKKLRDGFYGTVLFANPRHRKVYVFDLKTEFNDAAVKFVNGLAKDTDTLTFEDALIKSQTPPSFQYRGKAVYVHNGLANNVVSYSLLNGEKIMELSLNDSMKRVAFLKKFGSLGQYHETKKILSALGISNDTKIHQFYVAPANKDILLLVQLPLAVTSRASNDTFVTGFYAIITFNSDGVLKDIANVNPISIDYTSEEYLLKEARKEEYSFYATDYSGFFEREGKLYFTVSILVHDKKYN
ncbi:MAG: hypothetical protein QM642_11985 [Edaphocola sp.]